MTECTSFSQVGQTAISENPEEICYKLIFSLMRNIDQVVYRVKNPHSAEIRDLSYSPTNFVVNSARKWRLFSYLLKQK